MFNPICFLSVLKKYFVASCLHFLLFFFFKSLNVTLCHPTILKENPTNNIPVGQSHLKTVKSLRPSKLSKLQSCWTTAEERMAPPHTAAYKVKLIAEIFRKPAQFKGAVKAGCFHSAILCRDCVLYFVFAAFWPASLSKPCSHLGSALVLHVLNFPYSICFSCIFKDDTSQKNAVSREQLVWYAVNIMEHVVMDKHRLQAVHLPGFAGSCRVEKGGPKGPWHTAPLGKQMLI